MQKMEQMKWTTTNHPKDLPLSKSDALYMVRLEWNFLPGTPSRELNWLKEKKKFRLPIRPTEGSNQQKASRIS